MSNIFDIPQIPASPIENLQNDLHIGFGGDVAKRIQKVRWTDETRSTLVMTHAYSNAIIDKVEEALKNGIYGLGGLVQCRGDFQFVTIMFLLSKSSISYDILF